MSQSLFQVPAPLVIGRPPGQASTATDAMPQQGLAKWYDDRVRGGQSLVADNQDLVVSNAVHSTGEAQADGSIHVYGRAQGRLVAGRSGNTQARIMCLNFCPEIVSIAGYFHAFETIPDELLQQPVQIVLHEGTLYAQKLAAA